MVRYKRRKTHAMVKILMTDKYFSRGQGQKVRGEKLLEKMAKTGCCLQRALEA